MSDPLSLALKKEQIKLKQEPQTFSFNPSHVFSETDKDQTMTNNIWFVSEIIIYSRNNAAALT